MNRTALRLATIAALTNGGTAPYPTLAGNIVFDSRAEAVELAVASETYPMIIVHTERDHENRNAGNGRPLPRPLQRLIDLRLEYGITSSPKDSSGATRPSWPAADAQLEAVLDLFELQIRNALFGTAPWGVWWRESFGAADIVTERFVTVPQQGHLKVAAREMILRVNAPGECLPGFVLDPAVPPAAALTGLIKNVTDYIAANGGGVIAEHSAAVVQYVTSAGLPRVAAWPRLEGVNLKTQNVNVPGGVIDSPVDLDT